MRQLVLPTNARKRFDPQRIDEVGLMSLADVTRELVGILGVKLTAYIDNVSATRYVRLWEDGVPPHRPETLKRRRQPADGSWGAIQNSISIRRQMFCARMRLIGGVPFSA